jgi:hypothetical protein
LWVFEVEQSLANYTNLPTIGVAFLCELPVGEIRLSAENSDYAWFAIDGLPRIAFTDVSDALLALGRRTMT